jgi:hypothetical protein
LKGSDRQNFPGRLRSNAAAGGSLERVLAEVRRQLNVEDHGGAELISEGVEDAMEGRRPEW